MRKYFIAIMMFAGFSTLFYNCRKKSNDQPLPVVQAPPPSSNTVDGYMKQLSDPLTPEEGAPQELQTGDFGREGDYSCRTSTYQAGYGFDESLCLDPQTDVIYPAALVDGNSVVTGDYQPINLKRGGATLSTSLVTSDKGSSVTLAEVKLSSVRSAISELLNKDLASPPPAQLSFEIIEVFSENQLLASVAAGFGSKKINVKGSFDFSSGSTTSKFMIKFVQQYYSIDADAPSIPSEFISSSNDIELVKNQIKAAAPCYVSSVKYGRLAFFYVESSEERLKVKAALEATFKGAVNSGALEASISKDKVLSNSKITGTVIGGSGADAAKTISGKTDMLNYISNGGTYSKESPGAPIAYTLRLLSNNKVFRVVKATKYVMRECFKTVRGLALNKIKAWDYHGEIFGTITVSLKYDGETGSVTRTLWSRSRDQSADVGENSEAGGFTDAVNFDIDLTKKDKAYLEISTNLKEKDEKANCDQTDLSKNQSIDADDDMYQVTGKFYVTDVSKRSGLELEAVSKLLYFSRIGVENDVEVRRDNTDRYCRTGHYANPNIDVFFTFVE